MTTHGPATHLLLDRDGVLNDESHARYVLSPEAWEWLPGAREAVDALTAAGASVAVATNQSAVGRGLLTAETLDAIHARAFTELSLDFVLVCPHAPEAACACRKPAPGLVLEAARRWELEPARILVVGDSERDRRAALDAGARFALVLTGKGGTTARALTTGEMDALWGGRPFDDLSAFATAWRDARRAAPAASEHAR